MNHVRRLALVSLASLGTLASTLASAAWRTVEGSGTIVTQHRDATGLSRVAVGGDFEVEIRQGTREGIELTGDDNILPLVETRMEGPAGARLLTIATRDNVDWSSRKPIRVRVDLLTLSGLELGGGGHVVANGLHTSALSVSVGGSGAISLPGLATDRLSASIGGSGRIGSDGRANAVVIHIGGSGDCDFGQLAAGDVTVAIGGSGSATVNASRSLTGAIGGSGNIRYKGAVTPTVQVGGSGSVVRL